VTVELLKLRERRTVCKRVVLSKMSPPDSSDSETDPRATPTHKPGAGQQPGSESNDVVHSLGEALAGVTMGTGSSSAEKSFTSPPSVSSAPSTPFALAPGSAASQHHTPKDGEGWGNLSDTATTAFSSSSSSEPATATGRRSATSPSASAAGSAAAGAQSSRGGTGPGGERLELFLPHSGSSHGLTNDVFRFSHQNLPALGEETEKTNGNSFHLSGHQAMPPGPASATTNAGMPNTPGGGAYGEIRPASDMRRRTESPSCSVTGTTTSSRSVSPYTNSSGGDNLGSGGRVIHAYQRYEQGHSSTGNNSEVVGRTQSSFAEDDRSSSGYSMSHGHGSHPSLTTLDSGHRSPFAKDRTANFKNPAPTMPGSFASQQAQQQQAAPATTASTSASGQPQVLYMAVPSPDGRGQVLQPVQMVQLPGKPYHFVASTGGSQTPGSVVGADGNMSVLPPLSNQNGADVPPSPMENRSRVANYAIDTSANRSLQYSIDNHMQPGTPNDGYGRVSDAASQFQVDSAVSSLYSSPQRPPLDALLGEVRRLSRDQVGCRLVQQALDEEGPMAATLILNEGLPFWAEAMIDPFGNYLFQKVLEKVTIEERIMLVKSVSPRLVNASLNLHGTRSVQKVVEMCSQDEQRSRSEGFEETAADILVASLAPAAARLCIDSHGNHVIQRILLKLGPKHTKFVFDAVAASVSDVARHRHGCCVIQRCLDSPSNEARAHLVRRIVEKALELMQDAYGNYVVQYVLDVCPDEDVHAVCEAVVGRVNLLAIQKFSSNVMEKCLERCSDRVKEQYLQEMSDPERIRELMMDPFGNYVVQRALSVATHAQAIRLVEAMRPHLIATQTSGPHGQRNGGVRNTAGGRRIIAKICRRFPNFTLSPVGSQEELYNSNKGNHHRHVAHHNAVAPSPAVIGGYNTNAAVGAHLGAQLGYGADPRMTASMPGLLPVQQQQQQQPPHSYYTLQGGAPAYYDQYNGGFGGFPGM